MSKVKEKANRARNLLASEAFKDVVAEIQDNAVALFLAPNSSIDDIAGAHERIRAVETFLSVLRSHIDDEYVEDKKEDRHRVID